MADESTKKYYWLKLKRDFFKRHDIRIVEEMTNGKDYVLFYLKMLVESIDHDGELRFSKTIPYNEQMLSVITNTNIDIVRSAMKLFVELKMIDLLDDATIYMSEVKKLTGNETESAERVRKHRAKIDETKRLLQCNADVTKCNTEKEKEKEKEIEIEGIRGKPALKRFAPPAIDDVKAYCAERKNTVDAQHWYDYYSSNGWKVGKNPMKDWKAAVRTWEKNGYSNPAPPTEKVYEEFTGW